ncbi:hypothetical protein NB311A_07083 [Nitrobacter sp. Nb-311A]|uniref:hypothetical protein n=1 Tax=unclassified Nitrobacter TaxID=2620411 RepID=UPI0000684B7E|nr:MULTISPECIES: hypothetical protein [unclassified Nitrobacter]EAQ36893.1 hypothetical protein NB311A_07083 [Nitrobacter sp. Nb-311A]MCB1393576.1 hypothetical protein [Nitrobacter sp.]MCV0386833.1 hypothetical protein [Nitrobacter sp.]
MQGDAVVALLFAGGNDNAVNDFADGVSRFKSIVGMVKRGGQALDPAPVGFGDAGVNVGTSCGVSDSRAMSASSLASVR